MQIEPFLLLPFLAACAPPPSNGPSDAGTFVFDAPQTESGLADATHDGSTGDATHDAPPDARSDVPFDAPSIDP